MAKNITLMGASYPDVPAVQLPQTGGGVAVFMDADEIKKRASCVKYQASSNVNSVSVVLTNENVNILAGIIFTTPWANPADTIPSGGDGGIYAFQIRPSYNYVGFYPIKEAGTGHKITSMAWNDSTNTLTINYDAAKTKFINIIYA